jgi:hypothetical protein
MRSRSGHMPTGADRRPFLASWWLSSSGCGRQVQACRKRDTRSVKAAKVSASSKTSHAPPRRYFWRPRNGVMLNARA